MKPEALACPPEPRYATLHTDGWGGRQQQACVVVSETPMRFRVRALFGRELRLPSRGNGVLKVLSSGSVLVPKYAVTFTEGVQEALPGSATVDDSRLAHAAGGGHAQPGQCPAAGNVAEPQRAPIGHCSTRLAASPELGFVDGVLWAAAFLVNGYDQPGMAAEMCREGGVTVEQLRRCDVADRPAARKILEELGGR